MAAKGQHEPPSEEMALATAGSKTAIKTTSDSESADFIVSGEKRIKCNKPQKTPHSLDDLVTLSNIWIYGAVE